jgi:hypothetical protein
VRDLNFEQLFILAVVLLAALVNFVLDRLRNRGRTAQPQYPDEDLAVDEEEIDLAEAMRPQVVVPATLPDSRKTSPEPLRLPAPAQRATPSLPPRVLPPRSRAASRDGRRLRRRIDPSEARHGVVLMTILGPCRGVEPPAGNASGRYPRRERVE